MTTPAIIGYVCADCLKTRAIAEELLDGYIALIKGEQE